MPPEEAVEYLLAVIDEITMSPQDEIDDALVGKIPRKSRAALGVLLQRKGRIVSKEQILAVAYAGMYADYPGDPKTAASTLIKRARRGLHPSIEIEAVWGIGFRLIDSPA